MHLSSTPKKSGFGRFKQVHRAVGKVMRPLCWITKRAAPIVGGIAGSLLPGIGTAAGIAGGTAVSTAAGLGEKLWAK